MKRGDGGRGREPMRTFACIVQERKKEKKMLGKGLAFSLTLFAFSLIRVSFFFELHSRRVKEEKQQQGVGKERLGGVPTKNTLCMKMCLFLCIVGSMRPL